MILEVMVEILVNLKMVNHIELNVQIKQLNAEEKHEKGVRSLIVYVTVRNRQRDHSHCNA